ncbi:MAG: hypothetical protein EBE86_021700 [Hormoscilla sp. GUM202]|nr:hypothetical protein [Hormoscilla sp. GUM202]
MIGEIAAIEGRSPLTRVGQRKQPRDRPGKRRSPFISEKITGASHFCICICELIGDNCECLRENGAILNFIFSIFNFQLLKKQN